MSSFLLIPLRALKRRCKVKIRSPALKNSSHEITVIRITPDRVVAVPYNYQEKVWAARPGKLLDKRIR